MWKFLAKETLLEIVRSLITPTVVTGIGAVIGWLSGIPLFYLYIGMVALFTLTVTGLLRFSEWKDRITPEYKLSFAGVRVIAKKPDNGQVIKELGIGIEVRNFASFPIVSKIQEVSTQIGECYPPKKKYELDRVTIPPRSNAWFDDHFIKLESLPLGQMIEGLIKFKISYGREGQKLPYILTGQKKVLLKYPAEGGIPEIQWQDAPPTSNQEDG